MSLENAGVVDTNGSSVAQSVPDSAHIASLLNGHSIEDRAQKVYQRIGFQLIYLIAADEIGLYKIGYSDDPIRRLSELQRDSAFPLRIEATFAVFSGTGPVFEKMLHLAFAGCRTHGEWFRLGSDDLLFFEQQKPLRIEMDKVRIEVRQCLGRIK